MTVPVGLEQQQYHMCSEDIATRMASINRSQRQIKSPLSSQVFRELITRESQNAFSTA